MGLLDVCEDLCIVFVGLNWPEHEYMDLAISIGGKATLLKYVVCVISFLALLIVMLGKCFGGSKRKHE